MEDQLINKALDAFKQRAQLIQLNIGAPAYTFLNVDLHTESMFGGYEAEYEPSVSRMSSGSAPALDAGASQITVQVHGRIRLGVPQ